MIRPEFPEKPWVRWPTDRQYEYPVEDLLAYFCDGVPMDESKRVPRGERMNEDDRSKD